MVSELSLKVSDKFYNVYINDGPGLTFMYFKAMSNLVSCACEWGKNCYITI